MPKKKNILFIVSRLPINLQTGDRGRVYHFIEGLTARGHRVDMLGFIPDEPFEVRTNFKTLCNRFYGIEKENIEFKENNRFKQLTLFFESFVKGYPFRVWQGVDEKLINKAKEMVNEVDYDIIHFSETVTGPVFEALRAEGSRAKYVVDLIDSVALSLEKSLGQSRYLWPFRFVEKHRMKRYEKEIIEKADDVILISGRDKKFINANNAFVIPNGVVLPEFKGGKRDIDLLFTGNMAAEPNIDAVRWFVKKVMPYLPDLELYIVGSNPSPLIKKAGGSNVIVTGFVDDINAYYQRARLFVCPMRLGAGQKNKVLEAMANRTPVLSTDEGNIGINARDTAIETASSADAFVHKIKSLLNDERKLSELAENGYQTVKNNYSWQKAIDLLEQCYQKDVEK